MNENFIQAFGSIGGFVFKDNPWIFVVAAIIWLAMRCIQSDIRYVPTVPARLRIFCLPVFTLLAMPGCYFGGQEFGVNITPFRAVLGAIAAAVLSMGFHETIVEAIRKGKAIPIPFLTIPGAKPTGAAPATISITPSDQVTAPADPPEPNPPTQPPA